MPRPLTELEAQRTELFARLARIGDMRPGSITETFRRCGKRGCHCAAPGDPGHGPFYAYTTKVAGKTHTLQLRPGPLLAKIEREVGNYREFRATCHQLVQLNQAICEARPVAVAEEAAEAAGLKKKSRRPSRKRWPAK